MAQAYQDVATAQAATVEATVAQLNELRASLREKLNALPDAMMSMENEQANLSEQLAELETTAGKIQADAAVYGAGIDRIAQATEGNPISDTPRRKAVIFGLLGLILGLVGAFWRSERVRVIDGGEDAADAIGAPLLGELPRHPRTRRRPLHPFSRLLNRQRPGQYHSSLRPCSEVARESHPRALLVTSPEGKGLIHHSAQSGALGRSGRRRTAILVDAAGTVTATPGRRRALGLSDLVSQIKIGLDVNFVTAWSRLIDWEAAIRARRRIEQWPLRRRVPAHGEVLANLQQEADLLVIDAPPLLASPGGIKLAAVVDGVVLLVPRGHRSADA